VYQRNLRWLFYYNYVYIFNCCAYVSVCWLVCFFVSFSFFLSLDGWSAYCYLSLCPSINGCWKFLLSPTNWPEKNIKLVSRKGNERLTNLWLHDTCRCFCSSFSNVQVIITYANVTFFNLLVFNDSKKVLPRDDDASKHRDRFHVWLRPSDVTQ